MTSTLSNAQSSERATLLILLVNLLDRLSQVLVAYCLNSNSKHISVPNFYIHESKFYELLINIQELQHSYEGRDFHPSQKYAALTQIYV